MPRVANPARSQGPPVSTPQKSSSRATTKLPLNDDRQEKAARLQSRQALQDLQLNTLKAAASPMKKLNGYNRAASDSPRTPKMRKAVKDSTALGDPSISMASTTTPMKRMPLLANFEEWMKMATDNKINATNSWNFALIDYFHDMSLLKEGDGVNFQKASCTLDGCVKIYTSRVDSVATETGKLLSGLADDVNKKSRAVGGEDGSDVDEADGDETSGEDKRKTKRKRSAEATLAPSIASLQAKKMDLEISVDPLFKKASADFDEGGAKGLLLNHLVIDKTGRIVFDSSDETHAVDHELDTQRELALKPRQLDNINIDALAQKFFPDLSKLDKQDLCPSSKTFDLGDSTTTVQADFLKPLADWREEKESDHSSDQHDNGLFQNQNEDFAAMGIHAMIDDEQLEFGGGGEAWATSATASNLISGLDGDNDDLVPDQDNMDIAHPLSRPTLKLTKTVEDHRSILAYFDSTLQSSWAGPQHWRIKRIKNTSKTIAPATSKRKEKEAFEVDFLAPLDDSFAELLLNPVTSDSTISLPKAQWTSKTHHLLPDDKHFDSRELLSLFLKPKAHITAFKRQGQQSDGNSQGPGGGGAVDEVFWAVNQDIATSEDSQKSTGAGEYDADFFQDDAMPFAGNDGGPDEDVFDDAPEVLDSTNRTEGSGLQSDPSLLANRDSEAFGTQLVGQNRRARPEYVQYARVAKKVDVRKLKEEMWKGIGLPEDPEVVDSTPALTEDKPLKFTTIMNNLQNVYPTQAMSEISTSYCFICLLHLANEKGLKLDNDPNFEELTIHRDQTAGAEVNSF